MKTARAILPKGGYEKESNKLKDKLSKRKAELEALEKEGESLNKTVEQLTKKMGETKEWDTGYGDLREQFLNNKEAIATNVKDSEKAVENKKSAQKGIDDLDKIKELLIKKLRWLRCHPKKGWRTVRVSMAIAKH